jgi:hypothetical protein
VGLFGSQETVWGIDLPFLSIMESDGAVVGEGLEREAGLRNGKALGSNHVPALLSFSIHSVQSTCSDWMKV